MNPFAQGLDAVGMLFLWIYIVSIPLSILIIVCETKWGDLKDEFETLTWGSLIGLISAVTIAAPYFLFIWICHLPKKAFWTKPIKSPIRRKQN